MTDTETTDAPKVDKSEFGDGLCYCLGLYLAHAEGLWTSIDNYKTLREKRPEDGHVFSEASAVGMWIYGAADHIYGFDASSLEGDLKTRAEQFRSNVMSWRMPMDGQYKPTIEDATWSIKEAKILLRLIDENRGVIVKDAEWS